MPGVYGADFEQALNNVNVPSYVLDADGIVRWLNPAARRLAGDVRGRRFTALVAPDDRGRSREMFARKLAGTAQVTDVELVLVDSNGDRVAADVSSVPLRRGERVVGVFGQVKLKPDETPPPPDPRLTPRQAEVLRLLEEGRSTRQIAEELHLSPETVRNHVRHVLRALGVHSRLEAIAAARREHAAAT